VHRIACIYDVMQDMAFSADGRYLAAVSLSGLRVWKSATGPEVGHDSKYGGDSYSVDW
jgi:hypothetical protein